MPLIEADRAEARIRLRQERLYVALQCCGWGSMMVFYLVFGRVFSPGNEKPDPLTFAAGVVRMTLFGWAASHVGRHLVRRWGWKALGWAALVPRVLLLAFGLSLIWTLFGYGFQFGLMREPWPKHYPPPPLVITSSLINGTIIFLGWFGLYFSYHAFRRVRMSEIERLRLEASVKDAELRALKAQVNPHFMFNALNSVRALIDEDPARARLAVTQLANLLRYSLQSGALETVPFEDELQVVNDYLALEQVRHEERLRLRIDVAPEVYSLPVPPMLLQTLVENAVKYGISTRAEGGEIGIVARIVGDHLELDVSNPGRLATAAASGDVDRSTGVGLRNAADRLQLLFGSHASLVLRQQTDELVVAHVRVPLDRQVGAAPHPTSPLLVASR